MTEDRIRWSGVAFLALLIITMSYLVTSGLLPTHGSQKLLSTGSTQIAGVEGASAVGRASATGTAVSSPQGNDTGDRPCQGVCNGLPKDFGVTVGSVTGLFPGRSTTVPVRYTNPNLSAILVTQATVDVSGGGSCGKTNLVLGTYQPNIVIARNASVQSTLTLAMKAVAPNGCQGAQWAVTVTATAVKP